MPGIPANLAKLEHQLAVGNILIREGGKGFLGRVEEKMNIPTTVGTLESLFPFKISGPGSLPVRLHSIPGTATAEVLLGRCEINTARFGRSVDDLRTGRLCESSKFSLE